MGFASLSFFSKFLHIILSVPCILQLSTHHCHRVFLFSLRLLLFLLLITVALTLSPLLVCLIFFSPSDSPSVLPSLIFSTSLQSPSVNAVMAVSGCVGRDWERKRALGRERRDDECCYDNEIFFVLGYQGNFRHTGIHLIQPPSPPPATPLSHMTVGRALHTLHTRTYAPTHWNAQKHVHSHIFIMSTCSWKTKLHFIWRVLFKLAGKPD